MLLNLVLVASHAQEPLARPSLDPNAGRILVQHPYWAEPSHPLDCSMSGEDYTDLREALVQLRQREGSSIGAAARGHQCSLALDTVIRSGPFLGVHRVSPGESDRCTALLEPGPGGWSLRTIGDCNGVTEEERTESDEYARILSLAWWYPYGLSTRWNEHLGDGFSIVLDVAWQLPAPGTVPSLAEDASADRSGIVGPTPRETTMRGLVGFDLARRSLSGNFVGFRAGFESQLRAQGPSSLLDPDLGIVSFLFGHKWVGQNLALQIGAGGAAEIPMLNVGPRPETLTPVFELRGGWASR